MRHINNVVSETIIGNSFTIQLEAGKLLVESFGRPALQQYLDKRKLLEQRSRDKTSEGTPKQVLNDGVRPNHNTPVTRAQYPNKNATAHASLI